MVKGCGPQHEALAALIDACWTKPSWYVLANPDQTVHPDLQRFVSKRIKAETTEVTPSYVPMAPRLGIRLDTGLRRGDVVRIGLPRVRDGIPTIRTQKTGITVTVPITPALEEILPAGPCGDLAFICGERGQPFMKASFGNAFRDTCNAARVKKNAHGVRKIGAIRAANNGTIVAEPEAIFSWEGGQMALLYTVLLAKRRNGQARSNTGRTICSRAHREGAGFNEKQPINSGS